MWLIIAGILGSLSIALGAFGAHVLKAILDETMLSTFQTAVRYQMYQTFLLIGIGILKEVKVGSPKLLDRAGWFSVAGVTLFSGSLYLMLLTGVTMLGAITPLGGLAMITSWALFALGSRGLS